MMKNLKQTLTGAAFMLALLAGYAGAFEPQKDKEQKPPPRDPAVIKDQDKNKPKGNDKPNNDNNRDKEKKGKP